MNSCSTAFFPYPLANIWNIGPKYAYLKEIASDNYCSTCEAIENETMRHVAIKRFKEVSKDEGICRRILRELELTFCLKHPFILRPLDIIVHHKANEIYLVTELAHSDLRKLAKSPIYLDRIQVKVLMYNLLVGLDYLHSCGVVHRDLSPENVKVESNCTVKIGNFGLSRSMVELKCSKSDCDQAIKRNPLLKELLASPSSFMLGNFPDYPEFAEGAQKSLSPRFNKIYDFIMNSEDYKKTFKSRKAKNTSAANKSSERKALLKRCEKALSGMQEEVDCEEGSWHRMPEVVALEKVNLCAMDVWAAGCIFIKLLGMLKENASHNKTRRPLFPGTSCFPFPPSQRPASELDYSFPQQHKQTVTEAKRTMEDSEVGLVERASSRVKEMCGEKGVVRNLFPKEDGSVADLLEKMLAPVPCFRITAREALSHRFFADVRRKDLESSSEQELNLLADKISEGKNMEHLINVVLNKIFQTIK